MNAMDEAWMVLKGNPDARIRVVDSQYSGNLGQVSGGSGDMSARDFAAHPAAIGAANRQSLAEEQNMARLNRLQTQTGQFLPPAKFKNTVSRMTTPEQRMKIKNTSPFKLLNDKPSKISSLPGTLRRERGRITGRGDRKMGGKKSKKLGEATRSRRAQEDREGKKRRRGIN